MPEMLKPDICVIGAGSGGLTVAATAASFGVDVVLIERDRMGGDCLNFGCVPSKALIAAAKQAHTIHKAPVFGVSAGEPAVDFKAVHDHIHGVIGAIAPNDSVERFTSLGVKVIEAEASFIDRRTVAAGDYQIRPRRFVIATGSQPFVVPIPGLDKVPYLTNETIFDLTKQPGHLIIIGGGPIGIELAQAYARLGSQVTVLEAMTALGKDDPELTARVLDSVRADGVVVRDNTKVIKVAKQGRYGVRVTVDAGDGEETLTGTNLLVATGRTPNVDSLKLDAARVAHSRKGIEVGANLRTSNRRIYAIGDVAGGFQFTHWAGYQAGLVIRAILFRMRARMNNDLVPWATFTDPELAHVGLTEDQARKRAKTIRVLRWPFAENDRAQAERQPVGEVKVITDKKGRILGADIVGAHAGDLIGMWAMAIAKKMTVRDMTSLVLPYPTFAEINKRVSVSFYAPSVLDPRLRRLIRFLRIFG